VLRNRVKGVNKHYVRLCMSVNIDLLTIVTPDKIQPGSREVTSSEDLSG
jgi:hypothetical protein